jgi:hypothetical protein
MRIKQQRLKLYMTAWCLLLLVLCVPGMVSAEAISKAYRIEGNPTNGSLVSLDASKPGTGHLANIENSTDLLGTVVGRDDSLLAIDPADDKVQVAIGGEAPVLVSTVNGDIKTGDMISVSPLTGVGMKAGPGVPVIGTAQADFTARSTGATTRQVTDKNGGTETVSVGFVPVKIQVNNSPNNAESLNSLQRIVQGLTGRVIPTVRIILSLVIAVITLITLTTLIYGSIFGSIISIGRNPLAKSDILKSLRSVLVLALLLALVAGVALVLLLS